MLVICESYARLSSIDRIEPARSFSGLPWVKHLLESISYGVLVFDQEMKLVLSNPAGCQIFASDGGLAEVLIDASLAALQAGSARDFMAAARRAKSGERILVVLGPQDQRFMAHLMPVDIGASGGGTGLLVMTDRTCLCDASVLWSFGRAQNLTATEIRVLECLLNGLEPKEIANEQGVGLATVRSHISALLAKCGVRSMRALILKIARLPPVRMM